MSLFLILLALSFPFFYIWGIVAFIQWIISQSKPTSQASHKAPAEPVVSTLHPPVSTPSVAHSPTLTSSTPDLEISWNNWYAKNSINFLLYMGAFLIVASASIFVAFQWESIQGSTKAWLLTLITLAFFGCGLWFYTVDKIRSAGVTFTAIGSLLLPLCGVAWYNFVLMQQGVSYSSVWLMTSLICLLTYFGLAAYFKNVFYSYIVNAAALSLVLSFVNVNSLNKDYYVLGSILLAFVFLIGRVLLSQVSIKGKSTYLVPVDISSKVLLPVSLVYGFIVASSEGTLLSFSSSLAILLGSIFYYLIYSMEQQSYSLALAEVLFPLAIGIFFAWQKLSNTSLLLVLTLIGLCDIGISQVLQKSKLKEGAEISLFVAILLSFVVFLLSFVFGLSPLQLSLFALFPGLFGLIAYGLYKDIHYTALFSLFLAISSFIFVNNYLHYGNQGYVLALVYLAIGVFYYFLTIQHKDIQSYLEVFGLSSGMYLGLSFLFSWNFPGFNLIVCLAGAVILFLAAQKFTKFDLIYGSNILLYIGLVDILRGFQVDSLSVPIILSVFSLGIYFISLTLPSEIRERYKLTGIIASIATTVIFGLASQSIGQDMERNALITAYLTTFIVGFDAIYAKPSKFGYPASVAGMVTYLWQMKYLGTSESQVYFLPIGLYFMVVGHLRKLAKDLDGGNLLDMVGMILLFGSALISAFAFDGAKYALLLGVEGLIFILVGISINSKNYRYAGGFAIAAAIFSQTYNYIFSLPRWLITGIAGLIFLTVAIYLLLRRKEEAPLRS